jgi:hypothetical protein
MSSVQCWKQPAFAVSTFSPNFPFHGEIIPIKSGESGILSTISTIALLFTFYFLLLHDNSPSTVVAPPPSTANRRNCRPKLAFSRFFSRLSSPPSPQFSRSGGGDTQKVRSSPQPAGNVAQKRTRLAMSF